MQVEEGGRVTSFPVNARRIGECAGFHAAREPDREAAVHGGTRLTWRRLDEETVRWARALLAAGVAKGDRVAMLTPPCTEWLTVMLATTDVGAIWTGYHPRYRLPEFRHVTALAEPVVLVAFRRIHGRDYAGELAALKAEHPGVRHVVLLDDPLEGGTTAEAFLEAGAALGDSALEAARDAVEVDDTAVLIFTSGSTGKPKAAMIRHRALLTGAAVQNEHWPMDRPRILHMMPVNHIAGVGMAGVFGLYTGGTLVFQDRFDAGDLLRLLEEERIDHLLGSPVQFHMMANHPDLETRDLSSLKFMTWGGAPMSADLVARLRALPGERRAPGQSLGDSATRELARERAARAPRPSERSPGDSATRNRGSLRPARERAGDRAVPCRLMTSFGMTELGLYVTFTEPDASFEVLSRTIGKPHHGFEVRVAGADGRIARPGERGEIQARGDWLLAGYFRDPEATAAAFTADGWFRTGDVVKVWEDGNLEIVGRAVEMFISGGFNIYPREVEIVIEEHPDAGLVAVMGVPHETFGEVGHAFVEPMPGSSLDAAGLDVWCRERLANYKVPKTFEIRPALPRLPIGKIDRQALRRELAER